MMQCGYSAGHSGCQCAGSNLWSRAQKIRFLQDRLKILEDKKSEVKTLISELEAEK